MTFYFPSCGRAAQGDLKAPPAPRRRAHTIPAARPDSAKGPHNEPRRDGVEIAADYAPIAIELRTTCCCPADIVYDAPSDSFFMADAATCILPGNEVHDSPSTWTVFGIATTRCAGALRGDYTDATAKA